MMMIAYLLLLGIAGEPQVPPVDTISVTAERVFLPSRPAASLTEVIPQRVIDGIAKADSIEFVLLCPTLQILAGSPCAEEAANWLLTPYAIRKRGGYLNVDQRGKLLSILLDPGSYLVYQTIGDKKPCMGIQDVAFLFTLVGPASFAERTAVLVCHGCSFITIRNWQSNIIIDIDYAKDRILDFNMSLFPADSLLAETYERIHGKQ